MEFSNGDLMIEGGLPGGGNFNASAGLGGISAMRSCTGDINYTIHYDPNHSSADCSAFDGGFQFHWDSSGNLQRT